MEDSLVPFSYCWFIKSISMETREDLIESSSTLVLLRIVTLIVEPVDFCCGDIGLNDTSSWCCSS